MKRVIRVLLCGFLMLAETVGAQEYKLPRERWIRGPSLEPWRMLPDTADGFVRYSTRGTRSPINTFGFLKRLNDCNQDTLWLSLGVKKRYYKQLVDGLFRFKVGDHHVVLNFGRGHLHTVGGFDIIVFTNFVVGEDMIAALSSGKKLRLTAVSSNYLVEALDEPVEVYSTAHFDEIREYARYYCWINSPAQ